MEESVKYPEVVVQLTGRDGNAFFILGRVRSALEDGDVSEAEIEEFMAEAKSGDYDHLLQTVMSWVTVG